MARRSSIAVPLAVAATFATVYVMTPAKIASAGGRAEFAAAPEAGPVAAPVAVQPVVPSVYYSGCNEARAAGVAPIYRGQPGYREGMDGDGDGIACEPYRGY